MNFHYLIKEKRSNEATGKKLDFESRLYFLLPKKSVFVYQKELESNGLEIKAKENALSETERTHEFIFRTHILLDYISGMTDQYAVKIFQLLSGTRTTIEY